MTFPASKLLAWFRLNKREFPWRMTTDPFKVLITELLLRQTTASQVCRIYDTFFGLFPNPEAIVSASELEIVSVIHPLGLQHQRARALKEIAEVLLVNYGGGVPRTQEDLLNLPHVGLYIASAVRCFSFGEQVPVVDINVLRVISRFYRLDIKGDIRKDKEVWVLAGASMPRGKARDYNLAMLDLGALACKPRRPLCSACPVEPSCGCGKTGEGGSA